MKFNSIRKILKKRVAQWLATITDDETRRILSNNIIVSGGAITSLLMDNEINDVDIYLASSEAVEAALRYYVPEDLQIVVTDFQNIAGDTEQRYFVQAREDDDERLVRRERAHIHASVWRYNTKEKFAVKGITNNALTLNGKIQLIFRFYGSPDQIHKNFDFDHAKGYYTFDDNTLHIGTHVMSAVLQKSLVYKHSLYPLCSLLRTRKFLARGWSINLPNMLRIITDVKALDFNNMYLMRDQLLGVDVAYIAWMLENLNEAQSWAQFIEDLDRAFEHIEGAEDYEDTEED